jgi:hypothetical protein
MSINSAWCFTFILLCVFGVWCLSKRQNITFTPSFIRDNIFSVGILRVHAKEEQLKQFKLCILYSEAVAYSGILFGGGGGSTNSVWDTGQRERGSGGGSPLVRSSPQFVNECNPYSY